MPFFLHLLLFFLFNSPGLLGPGFAFGFIRVISEVCSDSDYLIFLFCDTNCGDWIRRILLRFGTLRISFCFVQHVLLWRLVLFCWLIDSYSFKVTFFIRLQLWFLNTIMYFFVFSQLLKTIKSFPNNESHNQV